MKRPAIIAIVVVLIAAAVGGWFWWQRSQTQQNGRVQVSGTVDADQVKVASLISGRIVEAVIAEGDVVERGRLLYRVDNRALQLQVDQAVAGVRAARIAYRQAVRRDESAADRAAAKAKWDQARAAEKIARVQLAYARTTAPADGTVTSVAAQRGEMASAGRTLATIAKTGSVYVRAFVPEPEIAKAAVGSPATITTDDGLEVPATVTFVASQAEFTPSNVETKDQRAKLVYEVRLKPESAEGLLAGMPVDVAIGE